ncbi:MAG: DUF1801 domain-containing protein [Pirellulaceae bacterium]
MRQKIPLFKKQAALKKQAGLSKIIDEYVNSLTGWKKVVSEKLRQLIRGTSRDLTEDVKWGWPCYTARGKCICGFMAMNETVNFVLYLGADLDDPDDLIEGSGKSMRHVKLRGPKDIRKAAFTKFIKQSISLVKK